MYGKPVVFQYSSGRLAAAKARGVKLGNPNLRAGSSDVVAVARDAHTQQARQRALAVLPFIAAAQRAGAVTLREIATAMEARGISTPSGRGRWHAATVLQTERIAACPAATAEPRGLANASPDTLAPA
jgi:hypothetical protein